MSRKHPQIVTLAVTIPAADVERVVAVAPPLVLDWDIVERDDRRSLCVSYTACGANARDVTRRLKKADVLYREDCPPETYRLCNCTGGFCTLGDEERTARIAAHA